MLITEEYKEEQRKLHIDRPDYGVASVSFAPMVTAIINKMQFSEILDYGCGKGRLGESINPDHRMKIWQYDPGIEGVDEEPEPCEFVTCIDVLEHIEPELIDNVLDDLKRVVIDMGYFTIHCGPAVKVLSDGRNAHLIQESYQWWLPKLWERFNIKSFSQNDHGFTVLVNWKE